jgi:hypothetical protein
MIQSLFTFPIVMIDGDSEDRKAKTRDILGNSSDDEDDVELIIGKASIPVQYFKGVTDRWLPTESSVEKALNGRFEACYAMFGDSGNFLCSWSKEKFTSELSQFLESYSPGVAL